MREWPLVLKQATSQEVKVLEAGQGGRVRQAADDPESQKCLLHFCSHCALLASPNPVLSRRSFCRWCRSSSVPVALSVLDSQGTNCFPFRILVQVWIKHGLEYGRSCNPAPGGFDLGRSSNHLGSWSYRAKQVWRYPKELMVTVDLSRCSLRSLPACFPFAQGEAGIVNKNSSKCSKRLLKKNTTAYTKLKEGMSFKYRFLKSWRKPSGPGVGWTLWGVRVLPGFHPQLVTCLFYEGGCAPLGAWPLPWAEATGWGKPVELPGPSLLGGMERDSCPCPPSLWASPAPGSSGNPPL